MSEQVYVVAFDGRDEAVVDMGTDQAKRVGARLHIVHVLEWSPYTFLTPEELADRHRQREQDFARATQSILTPILAKVRGQGVDASGEVRFGNVTDAVIEIAKEQKAAMIFAGRSSSLSARVFGSVASGLAQSSPAPVVIVP